MTLAILFSFFFFNDTATTEIYTLSLHDALPISLPRSEETIQLMAKKGVAADPTLIPYQIIFDEWGGYFGSTSRRFTFSKDANLENVNRSEEHTSELQSQSNLVCRLLLEKKRALEFCRAWPSARGFPPASPCHPGRLFWGSAIAAAGVGVRVYLWPGRVRVRSRATGLSRSTSTPSGAAGRRSASLPSSSAIAIASIRTGGRTRRAWSRIPGWSRRWPTTDCSMAIGTPFFFYSSCPPRILPCCPTRPSSD